MRYNDLNNLKIKLQPLKQLLNCEILNLKNILNHVDDMKHKLRVLTLLQQEIKTNNFDWILENENLLYCQLSFVFDKDDISIKIFEEIIVKKKNPDCKYEPYTLLINLKDIINKKVYDFKGQLYISGEKDFLDKVHVYNSILFNLSKNLPVKPFQYVCIKKLLKEKNFDIVETLGMFVNIEAYNNVIFGKDKYIGNEGVKDILSIGYEIFPNLDLGDIDNFSIQKKVDNLFETCSDYIDDYEIFKLCLPVNDSNIYNRQQYQKIYYDFMKKIQSKIMEIVDTLKDDDFYFNKDFRNEILSDYQKWTGVYINCRNFFETELISSKNSSLEQANNFTNRV